MQRLERVNDTLLRQALAPSDAVHRLVSESSSLAEEIYLAVSTEPQHRRLITWPWEIPAYATAARRRRASILRVGFASLLVLVLLAGIATVASQRPVVDLLAGGPIQFVRGGDLLAVDPYVPGSGPVVLISTHRVVDVSWAPDRSRVLVHEARPDRWSVLGADGRGLVEVAAPDGTTINWISAWSPDGKSMVAELSARGVPRLGLLNPDTGAIGLLGSSDLPADWPAWSPDGRFISFRARPDGTLDSAGIDVFDVTTSATSHLIPVGSDLRGIRAPRWLPSSSSVVFDATDGLDRRNVWIADVAGGRVARLSPRGQIAFGPEVSPDGQAVAYNVSSGRNGLGCNTDGFVVTVDGTDPHRVIEHAWIIGWAPDGAHILVETTVATPGAPLGGVATVRPDGSDFRLVVPFIEADRESDRAAGACRGYHVIPRWR